MTATTTPRQRVAEFLGALGRLLEDDLYVVLRFDEVDQALVDQWTEEMEAAQARVVARDNPDKNVDVTFRTFLTQIMRRAAEVNRAGTDEIEPG
jgi:hypothetical protein